MEPHVHSLRKDQGVKTTGDPAFKALTQVLGAARAMTKEEKSYHRSFRVVFPIVVLNTTLFEAFLDDSSNVQVELRDEMALLWRGTDRGSESVVHIVTEERLPHLISRLLELTTVLPKFEKDMVAIVEQHVGRSENEKSNIT
jgi:hypothetical protein